MSDSWAAATWNNQRKSVDNYDLFKKKKKENEKRVSIFSASRELFIMKKLLILLSFCVLFSLSGTLSNAHSSQRNKALVLKNKLQLTNKNFIGLLLVPCMFLFV